MTARGLALAATFAAAVATGCGGEIAGASARDSCYEVWDAVCTRYYQCYTPSEIAEIGLPATPAQCAVLLGDDGCVGFSDNTCPNNVAFHPTVFESCTDAIVIADCAVIADAPDTVPACDGVCE